MLDYKPSLVFIMLGKECNLNCRYCLQHKIFNNEISHTVNPEIYDFLDQYRIPRIQFFGGEPLLFFPLVKEITAEITKRYSPSFSLMTNGKLLTKEKISWFNDHDFWIAVSYDGYNSDQTRGFDVIEEKRDLLLQINSLSLSGVISSMAYPLEICSSFQEFCDLYKENRGHYPGVNYDNIFNTGSVPEDLLNLDLQRLYNEISLLAREYISVRKGEKEPVYTRYKYIDDIYQDFKQYYQDPDCRFLEDHRQFCRCNNGYAVLNLGLDGFLYSCHNSDQKLGTIYDSLISYLSAVIRTDQIFERDCSGCPAISYCKKGCKLVKDLDHYCNMRQTIFSAIADVLREGV